MFIIIITITIIGSIIITVIIVRGTVVSPLCGLPFRLTFPAQKKFLRSKYLGECRKA